jgi:hypothetical protein
MKKERRALLVLLALAVGLIVWSKRQVEATWQWKFPPVTQMVVTENYMSDLGALLLGARRLAGDLAYIQFLQYYGTRAHTQDHETEEEHEEEGHVHGGWDGGDYPRVREFGTRLIRLDPYFNKPILEMAGALAFNLRAVDSALALLRDGIVHDPSFHRYRLYVAAILYKNDRKDKELIELLKEAIQYPDCPVLFQNTLGGLLRKTGDYRGAVQVYRHIAATAAYEHERDGARKRLEVLYREHPELATQ